MPRFSTLEPVYKAFQEFSDRCLVQNKSFLWPEKTVWTPVNVSEVKKRLYDNPMLGTELSFTQKLQEQMRDALPEQWMLLADIYYLYYLPSRSITVQSKRSAINWAIEQSKPEAPSVGVEVWQALETGFARTSQRYHLKYAQFWLIILLANHLKSSGDAAKTVHNRKELQLILDNLLKSIPAKVDRAQDMRHALLYMAFPDDYEPILSNTDKAQIVRSFRNQVIGEVSPDTDEAIKQVREALSQRFFDSELPFSFYGNNVKEQWKPVEKASNHAPTDSTDDEGQESEIKSKTIFISYRRDDSADVTGRIYDWLVDKFSEEQVFKDVDSIPLGVNFKQYLTDNVSKCHVLLAVIGKQWLTIANSDGLRRIDDPADFVRIEIEAALSRGIKVIPVLVQGVRSPAEQLLPQSLKELTWRQGIEIRPDPDFRHDIDKLIKALTIILREN